MAGSESTPKPVAGARLTGKSPQATVGSPAKPQVTTSCEPACLKSVVLGWTRTWANYLSRQQSLFDEHPRSITFGELAAFEVDRGIEDKLWGPAPGDAAEERSDSTAEQAGADAVLAAAGIVTRDLLSMLADDDPEQSDILGTVPTQRRSRQRRKTDTGEISARGKRGGQ